MKKTSYSNVITLIFSFSICSFILFFHLIYSFEDIGAKLQEILDMAKKATLEPLPESNKLVTMQKSMFLKSQGGMSSEQIELGKILYFDPRLSGNKMLSCNSCHNISLYGTSYITTGKGKLNAPTLFNSLFNVASHYNGDISRFDMKDSAIPAKNVIARAALHALTSDNEMNGNIQKIISLITESSEYMSYFKRAYGVKVKVNADLIALSLSSFIMTLNTFSRYDDFMAGNLKAMSLEEAQGMRVFIEKGCVACHNGIGLGGSMQPFEVMKNYKFANIGSVVTDADKMVKVPTLRNITLTKPYFHNGGFENLEDAIKEMGNIQLGINISSKEVKQIMTFFETLRGSIEITTPPLPK